MCYWGWGGGLWLIGVLASKFLLVLIPFLLWNYSDGFAFLSVVGERLPGLAFWLFASQRSAVGSNHNPTVGEFNRALLVKENTKAISITSKRGNCRGSAQPSTVAVDETPLRKRQRKN